MTLRKIVCPFARTTAVTIEIKATTRAICGTLVVGRRLKIGFNARVADHYPRSDHDHRREKRENRVELVIPVMEPAVCLSSGNIEFQTIQ